MPYVNPTYGYAAYKACKTLYVDRGSAFASIPLSMFFCGASSYGGAYDAALRVVDEIEYLIAQTCLRQCFHSQFHGI